MLLAFTALTTPQAAPGGVELSELWAEPEPGRNLFDGVGGTALAPNPGELFTVTKVKRGGFSDGYTVRDRAGRTWSAKLYPEARTEVVASRICGRSAITSRPSTPWSAGPPKARPGPTRSRWPVSARSSRRWRD